jgi:hypothetical protein
MLNLPLSPPLLLSPPVLPPSAYPLTKVLCVVVPNIPFLPLPLKLLPPLLTHPLLLLPLPLHPPLLPLLILHLLILLLHILHPTPTVHHAKGRVQEAMILPPHLLTPHLPRHNTLLPSLTLTLHSPLSLSHSLPVLYITKSACKLTHNILPLGKEGTGKKVQERRYRKGRER